MFLPVVLCGSVRAAAFSPTQLSGYVNSPYNIALLRSQGKLWQDTAMTVPAVADGDPVRRIDCNGTYYDAPSDAARPLLYSEGGGKWSLAGDGVDDQLWFSATIATPFVIGLQYTGPSDFLFSGSEDGGWAPRFISNTAGLWYTATVAIPQTGHHTVVMWARTSGAVASLEVRVDGAQTLAPTDNIASTAIHDNPGILGCNVGHSSGRLLGICIAASDLSLGNAQQLETYLAALAP